VPHNETLASLATDLMASSCFEDAATVVLERMLAVARAVLESSEFGASSRLLRGVVHVRPGDSYQRLFGIEHPSLARMAGAGHLTSANVWKWIAENRCSVSIDVQLETIRPWSLTGPMHPILDSKESSGLPGHVTREHMINREATHVHVVPLRTPSGAVDGMIALEASCRDAMGRDFIWGACDERLRLCASIAAPYLCALPLKTLQVIQPDEFLPVIGPTTANLIELVRIFARQEETLLISGPTGAGKSRLARWCHEHSGRSGHSFETLDLLSVPEDLQMAELFGWKRGAFTSAIKDNPGAIARARRGTLFIDEIDKLSLKAQAGLLHVLEERRYRPLGEETGDRQADVRFIIGTNADLRATVRAGRFREDLYYRINVLPVRLPPLSERLDELPLWAEYMLKRRHGEGGTGAVSVAEDAVKLLLATPWPGNLRQLDNIIRRAYVLALHAQGGAGGDLALERQHVEKALAHDPAPDSGSLPTHLWRAAHAYVQEAERRQRSGSVLPLEMSEAFRGMVLGAAILRLRDRDEAFEVLGEAQLIKHRNHHKHLRRELEKVRKLLAMVGGRIDPDLAALLAEIDDPTDLS
jgi:DNA-binding NtrC family response regulator